MTSFRFLTLTDSRQLFEILILENIRCRPHDTKAYSSFAGLAGRKGVADDHHGVVRLPVISIVDHLVDP